MQTLVSCLKTLVSVSRTHWDAFEKVETYSGTGGAGQGAGDDSSAFPENDVACAPGSSVDSAHYRAFAKEPRRVEYSLLKKGTSCCQ